MALRSVCVCVFNCCCCYFWRNAIAAQNTKSSNNNNNTENTRNKFCCCCSHKSLSQHSLSPALLLSGRTVASQRRAHTHQHTYVIKARVGFDSVAVVVIVDFFCFTFCIHDVICSLLVFMCVWVCLITTVAVLVCVCVCSLLLDFVVIIWFALLTLCFCFRLCLIIETNFRCVRGQLGTLKPLQPQPQSVGSFLVHD